MEDLEKWTLYTAHINRHTGSDIWLICLSFGHTERSLLEDFLTNLNNSIEIEEDGKLPFLDMRIEKKDRFGHATRKKPPHTEWYLNANSHHHLAQKYIIMRTFINRAMKLAELVYLHKERHINKEGSNEKWV